MSDKKMVVIGKNIIAEGYPTFIIAELGINHNGDLDTLREMVYKAGEAGADAVKIQMRTPEVCVPRDQWDNMRETPWGYISYIEYRHKIELGFDGVKVLEDAAREMGIIPMSSVWDKQSFDRYVNWLKPQVIKIPSACITDHELLQAISQYNMEFGVPVILSVGGSSSRQVHNAVINYPWKGLIIMHTTSAYPCPDHQLNLRGIKYLEERFLRHQIGYSNHSPGIIHCATAVALGAQAIEAHFTLDRSMWGTDQSASFEPGGFHRMVKYVRATEKALGTGGIVTYLEETLAMEKLRRVK